MGALSVKKRRIKRPLERRPRKAVPPLPPAPRRSDLQWWRLLLRPMALLPAGLSICASLIGLVAVWNGAVPSIAAAAASGGQNPLLGPFVLSNEGSLLTFKDVITVCSFDHLVWSGESVGGVEPSGMSVSHPQPHGSLFPGQSVTVDCDIIYRFHNFSKFHITANLASARVQVTVRYEKLFLEQVFRSQHFCWTPTPPDGHQWVLCDHL